MRKMILLLAIMTVASIAAFADIAPEKGRTPKPKPQAGIDTFLDIRLDPTASEARLIIPKSQLKQLRAELELLDDGSNTAAGLTSTSGISGTQTIVSGLFLSLALVFGGLWFVRSGRTQGGAGKGLVAASAIATVGLATTLVYANIGPPPSARTINGKMFSESMHTAGFGWGKIKLEAGDINRAVLIVPNPRDERPGSEE